MKKKALSLLLVLLVASCNNTSSKDVSSSNPSSINNSSTSSSSSINNSSTSSSSSIDDVTEIEPWLKGETVEGNPLIYNLTVDQVEAFMKRLESAKVMVESETNFDEFKKTYDDATTMIYSLLNASEMESVKYDIYGNSANLDLSSTFDNYYYDIMEWFNVVEHLAFNNSFKSKLFPGLSDDLIVEIIGQNYPSEYYAVQKELNDLENQFRNLDYDGDDYYSNVDDIYVNYVNASNNMAETYLNDYTNYMDYAYENIYYRDFTMLDASDFYNYVIEYVVPVCETLHREYMDNYRSLSDDDKELFRSFIFGNGFTDDFSYIEDYRDFMGGDYQEAFDNLFNVNGGNYYISYEDDAYQGAYMTMLGEEGNRYPMVYYGNGYQSYQTIVHEFGHYFEAIMNGEHELSYDLAESQSQGNEYLFLEYLAQNKFANNGDITPLAKAIIYRFLSQSCELIVLATLVDHIEQLCYNTIELKKGDLEQYVLNEYEAHPELKAIYPASSAYLYIQEVTMLSPCYYISYATSLIAAMNVNKIAENDLNKGKEAYLKLINHPNKEDFIEVCEYAGLSNPFKEETFISLLSNY